MQNTVYREYRILTIGNKKPHRVYPMRFFKSSVISGWLTEASNNQQPSTNNYNLWLIFFTIISFHSLKSPAIMCLRASRTSHI